MDAEVNTKGRVIYKGPKGGFYVLDAKGKKVYKFTRAAAPVPTKALTPAKPKTPSPNKNTKGRVIYKGPKGGFYVLDAKGKKVYKFTRSVPKVLTPKAPSPPLREGVRKSPLMRLLQAVRKRREVLKRLKKEPTIETRTFKRFSTIRAGVSKRASKDSTLSIKIPEEIDKIKNGTVLAIRKDFLPTQKWLDDQAKYIQGLNEYDYLTAMAYTVRSHEWIGPWLRGSKSSYHFSFPDRHTAPLYPQIMKLAKEKKYSNESWARSLTYDTYMQRMRLYGMGIRVPKPVIEQALDMYAKDLYRIVRGAPPVPQTMYVFRGTLRNIFEGRIGYRHVLNDFASAAYIPQRGYAPSNYLRIKLVKGVRALLLQGLNQWNNFGEFEVLINRNSMYKITKRNMYRPVINKTNAKTVTKKYVTDVTVF